MTRWRQLVVIIWAMMAMPGFAAQGSALEAIQARLQGDQLVRGAFEQSKFVAGFAQALRSSGRFVFSPEHGVLWLLEQPYRTQFVLSAQGIAERDADGQWTRHSADQQPALQLVYTLTSALLQADIPKLQSYFSIQAQIDAEDQWTLRLRTTDEGFARFIEAAELSGADQVQRLDLRETGGDRTEISLHPDAAASGDLNSVERELFLGH